MKIFDTGRQRLLTCFGVDKRKSFGRSEGDSMKEDQGHQKIKVIETRYDNLR